MDERANNLLDVIKYRSLRHLWKISDRNLGNSLAEDYNKVFLLYILLLSKSNILQITKCIENSKKSFYKNLNLPSETLISKNYESSLKYKGELICPMFNTCQDVFF